MINPGYVPCIDTITKKLKLTASAVYGKVWAYEQLKDGICRAAQQTIADELGIGRDTVNTALKKLVDAGYIKKVAGKLGKPNYYKTTGKAGIQSTSFAFDRVSENATQYVGKSDTSVNINDDKIFSGLIKQWEKITGTLVTRSDGEEIAFMLDDWNELQTIIDDNHPSCGISATKAITKAMRETGLKAKYRTLGYTKKIIENYMKNGIDVEKPGKSIEEQMKDAGYV